MAAHLLSQPCPGSWRFVAHECQPRRDDGSEHCSWFPQFFIPSQISCLLFSHRLTEVIICIPYISPTLSTQCNEFLSVYASTPTAKVSHASGTARIPLCLFVGHLQPQDTTDVISVPEVLLFFAIPWTVAYQVPPSVEFSRPQSWSELPFPSPGQTLPEKPLS